MTELFGKKKRHMLNWIREVVERYEKNMDVNFNDLFAVFGFRVFTEKKTAMWQTAIYRRRKVGKVAQ